MSPKSRKRTKPNKKRLAQQRSPRTSTHPFRIFEMSPPFPDSTPEETEERIKAFGESFSTQYQKSFEKLQARLLTLDPLLLLAALSFYGLFHPPDRNPEFSSEHPILQHHIELVQSLILRSRTEDFEFRPALPQDLANVHELVENTSRAFHMRRFANFASQSEDQRHRLKKIEEIRVHTQAVRNWAYPQQIRRIVTELFSPLDDEIEQQTGVRVGCLLAMWFELMRVVEERMNCHTRQLLPVIKSKTILDLAEKYHEAIPELISKPNEMLEFLVEQDASLREARLMVLSHSDLRLPDKLMFSLDDFLRAYPRNVDLDVLRRIVDNWALSFGELAERDPEHFFMANPVWSHPLIKTGHDMYFVPIVGLFLQFSWELMESVIKDNADLYSRYKVRRAKFLEEDIERLLKHAFPSATVYRGSMWHDPITDKVFENDLLVLIDSFIIIVEAKSGKVPDSARRGAEARLQDTVDKLLIDPSMQAKRFAEFLQNKPGIHTFPTRHGIVNQIDNTKVYKTFGINIILDLFGNLQTSWTDLRQGGFITPGMDIGPTMSLADFECVLEILDGACEKLHYLIRRAELEVHAEYSADELDLLSFYLDTGFNIGEAEFDGLPMVLHGLDNALNPYFMREWTSIKAAKPRCRRTRWWMDILQRLEERPIERWTELGYILLSTAFKDQVLFEKEFRRVKTIVKTKWRTLNHKNVVSLLNGPARRRDAIVGCAYKRITKVERNEIIVNAAMKAIDQEPTDRALVIGVNVDYDHYPYSVIACVSN